MVASTAKSSVVSADQRYAGHIAQACNLDTLLWANQTTLLGITVLGWGAVAAVSEKRLAIGGFGPDRTLGLVLLSVAVLYAVTLMAKVRMRYWHVRAERCIVELDPGGYFAERAVKKHWALSAPRWSLLCFGLLAGFALIMGVGFMSGLVTTPGPIDASEAERHGVRANHQIMDNGEQRYRLTTDAGNGYILTRSGPGGWQNSHSHAHVAETYIVESGWVVYATDTGGPPKLQRFERGGVFTTAIGQVHNIYMSAGSEIHTVKHGSMEGGRDWIAAPDFDLKTQSISFPG